MPELATIAEFLRDFVEVPWDHAAGFVAMLIGLFVLLPQLPGKLAVINRYVQRRMQALIGVPGAVHEAVSKIETRVEERHAETMGRFDVIEEKIEEGVEARALLNGRLDQHIVDGHPEGESS